MNKKSLNLFSKAVLIFLTVAIIVLLPLLLPNFPENHTYAAGTFSSQLSVDTSKWIFDISGSLEKITQTPDGWLCTAGGNVASTHYARIRYKLPEQAGIAPTTFYQKAIVVLPPDFYTKQVAYFRIMSTDNYPTTLNGHPVGSSNGSTDFRTGVYFFSDHFIRLRSEHEGYSAVQWYEGQLPVGQHTLELFGDVANVAPWWFKIDGITVASGIDRLSPNSVPPAERVVTRLVAGIDGAAGYNTSSLSLLVKDVVIADHDISQQIPLVGDVNGDGHVDIIDIGIAIDNYGKNPITNPKADVNHDGVVDIIDIGLIIDNYGK